MNPDFAAIAFTPAVRSLQSRMGSRRMYARADEAVGAAGEGSPGRVLGAAEIDFIRARDSFYLATVSETGWPYVQHKGGPIGFLRVLGPHLLGYADYRGNRQYVSDGNLMGNDRVSLLLIDYANQQRLKVMGQAKLVEADADPDLAVALQDPRYRARIERAVVIDVSAWDWNCPQHITPRFTRAEWEAALAAERSPPVPV